MKKRLISALLITAMAATMVAGYNFGRSRWTGVIICL